MKRLKFLPSILMLVLSVAVLALGVYAANPSTNTITGQISVNASNSEVSIQCIKNGVVEKTYNTVRGGITWTLNLEFDVETANRIEQVRDIELILRITNKSTEKDLGAYFFKQGSTLVEDATHKTKLATADNITTYQEFYHDNNAGNDKFARAYMSSYSYIAPATADDGNSYETIDMKIYIMLERLFNDPKSATFNFGLNIEEYFPNVETVAQGTYSFDSVEGEEVGSTTTVAYALSKIAPTINSIPNAGFVNCDSLEYLCIPSSVITIGNNVFEMIDSFSGVSISNSVSSIGSFFGSAYSGYSPKSIFFPNTNHGCKGLLSKFEFADWGGGTTYGASDMPTIKLVINNPCTINFNRNTTSLPSRVNMDEYEMCYYLGNISNPYLHLICPVRASGSFVVREEVESTQIGNWVYDGTDYFDTITFDGNVVNTGTVYSRIERLVFTNKVTRLSAEWGFFPGAYDIIMEAGVDLEEPVALPNSMVGDQVKWYAETEDGVIEVTEISADKHDKETRYYGVFVY